VNLMFTFYRIDDSLQLLVLYLGLEGLNSGDSPLVSSTSKYLELLLLTLLNVLCVIHNVYPHDYLLICM